MGKLIGGTASGSATISNARREAAPTGLSGLYIMPTREMPGASLFNVSSIFPKIENSMSENPVTLRPGRARLSTAPDAIGSVVKATTIGNRTSQLRQDRNDTIANDNNDVRIQLNEIRSIGPHQIHVACRPTLVELNVPALGPSQSC